MPPPLPKFFCPFTVVAGVADQVTFAFGGTKVATVAPGTYYSFNLLGTAIAAAMTAQAANAWQVVEDELGASDFSGTANFQLLWGSGGSRTQALAPLLGWPVQDSAVGAGMGSPNQHRNAWFPGQAPLEDSREVPVYVRSQARALSQGGAMGLHFGVQKRRSLKWRHLPAWKVWKVDEGEHLNEAWERVVESVAWNRLRYWPDQSVEGTWADYSLDLDTAKTIPWNRAAPNLPRYSLDLVLWRYGA